MRNINEGQMLQAYEKILVQMKKAGIGTERHVLDNKISKEYEVEINSNGATHELVSPK